MSKLNAPMTYRQLGRTPLWVSAVGFGTCQLRLKTEQEAIDTLLHGFSLGVNLVHTAPDYEGADSLVAQAVRESGQNIIVASQGYGDMAHFEYLFEETCRKLGKRRLELFGIAAVEDRELLGEPVWGPGGMIDFLRRKKQEGRLLASFCTTHGTPEQIARLVDCGDFDAVMLAFNPLGFHLLSYSPEAPVVRESLLRNGSEILPRAAKRRVGIMVMKPLAGGLLTQGKAFPPRAGAPVVSDLSAGTILKSILLQPGVSCVFPGTASVAEADENARAGFGPLRMSAGQGAMVNRAILQLQSQLCSRCGICDDLCSQRLPVSWLFRDAYINLYPSETFETLDRLQYFHLHPAERATCLDCEQVTCACPHGINIPQSLPRLHAQMTRLRQAGVLSLTPTEQSGTSECEPPFCRLVKKELPDTVRAGESWGGALWLQNDSAVCWRIPTTNSSAQGSYLGISSVHTRDEEMRVSLRHDVEPGTRTHFAFRFLTPSRPGKMVLRFELVSGAQRAIVLQHEFCIDAT